MSNVTVPASVLLLLPPEQLLRLLDPKAVGELVLQCLRDDGVELEELMARPEADVEATAARIVGLLSAQKRTMKGYEIQASLKLTNAEWGAACRMLEERGRIVRDGADHRLAGMGAPKTRSGAAARAAESPVRVKSPRKPRAPKETTVIDDAIRACVRTALAAGPCSLGQLTKATQLLGTVVEAALGEMINDGDVLREGQGRGLKYRLRALTEVKATDGGAKQPGLFEAQA